MTRYEQEYYDTVTKELPRIRKTLETNAQMREYLLYVEICIAKEQVPEKLEQWRLTKNF